LQHRDTVSARIRKRGNQSQRGRATADHDDILAGVVELIGPVLQVHDRPDELVLAGEVGRVGLETGSDNGASGALR
jgi:hypothetical protein